MALLEIEDLQTHFRTQDGVNRAVDGISFHVNEGETLAVVGESGCGKSVTAMSILRLVPEPPAKIAGSIRFQGTDLLPPGVDGGRRQHHRHEESDHENARTNRRQIGPVVGQQHHGAEQDTADRRHLVSTVHRGAVGRDHRGHHH